MMVHEQSFQWFSDYENNIIVMKKDLLIIITWLSYINSLINFNIQSVRTITKTVTTGSL